MDTNYIITSTGSFIRDDDLYHWGIKGMKWGVRRYQNPDGSLTAAGKKRYTNPDGSLNEKGKKKFGNSVKSDSETPKRKTAKDMTDEELDKAITRARKEDEYNRLRPEPKEEIKDSNYKKLMAKVVNEMIVPAVIQSGRNALQKALDKQANDLLKDKIDPNSVAGLTAMRDKLKLKDEIEKLRNKSGENINWDNMLKKQQYESNKKKAEQEDAKQKAEQEARERKIKAEKEALEREMNAYREYQEAYKKSLESKPSENTTYRNNGGERTYVNPNETRALAVVNNYSTSLVPSLSRASVSSGKSTVDSYSDYEVLDRDGNIIFRNRDNE